MSASPAEIPRSDGAMTPSQLFVINLCASTSPMALAQPNVPALKRYTFFVSRQRDDGRDRFRLHMGYFASQEEAAQMLDAVRDVYPAAWAGPAPASGAPRRARAAATPVPVVPIAVVSPLADSLAARVVEPAPHGVAAEATPPVVPVVVAQPAPAPDVLDAMSNVREVLATLDDAPVPRLEAAGDVDQQELGETEVLRVLEASAQTAAASGKFLTQPHAQVRLLTAQDTQTLADIQSNPDRDAQPCFAVQLVWSVSPIDVTRLPHLAIFDAYTLYNVEGKRDGRKWYGVRLGFFSDQVAATQVAGYVRSDYRAVAIVPVSPREREGAGGEPAQKPKPVAHPVEAPKPVPAAAAAIEAPTIEGFKLLEDDRPAPLKLDLDDASASPSRAKTPAQPAPANRAAAPVAKPVVKPVAAKPAAHVPGKATGRPVGKRVVARKRPAPRPGAPNPLESTLEILGASTLTLDESREIINDSAVRKPLERKSGGRFSRLLNRLAGN